MQRARHESPIGGCREGCVRDTTRENLVPMIGAVRSRGFEYRAHREGRLTCGFPGRLVVLTIGLLIAAVGCTKQVTGTAEPDPNKPPLAVSKDGFGIVAGFDDAPAKIEIYTEPQCNPLRGSAGRLRRPARLLHRRRRSSKVTYRPLTFLDDDSDGYSAQVSNALFLAAEGGCRQGTRVPALRRGAVGPPATRRTAAHRRRNGRTWQRRPACRTTSPRTSPAAGQRSTSRTWTTPTSSTCTRSTRWTPARQRFTTSTRTRSSTSTTTTGSTSSFRS